MSTTWRWTPFSTAMEASWPVTSGSTRTSVVRTTPMIGGPGSAPCATQTAAPATRTSPTAMRPIRLGLGMDLPPFHGISRDDRQREIDQSEAPESDPVAGDLPDVSAQLVGADQYIDGEIRREHAPQRSGCGRERFARPGESGRKELRQAGREQDDGRVFRTREPGPHRL